MKDASNGLRTGSTFNAIARFNLMVGQTMMNHVFKISNFESRFYTLLPTNLGESLFMETGPGELAALRLYMNQRLAMSPYDTGSIPSIYAALAWQEAFNAGIKITGPLQITMNQFSNISQVTLFREELQQSYSLMNSRMKQILTVAEGNDNPALMLELLNASEIKLKKDEDYKNLFKIVDESQIDYANGLLAGSKSGGMAGSTSVLTEAAKGVNCTWRLHTVSNWLLKQN
jgi:hypothetical protein